MVTDSGRNAIVRVDPTTKGVKVWPLPKASINANLNTAAFTVTPQGEIYYMSLAGSYLGKPDLETGATEIIEPKTQEAGTRRVWSDSKGRL